jgi:uncharacterized protein YjdB
MANSFVASVASWRISRFQLCLGLLIGLAACGSGSDAVSGPGTDSTSAEFYRSSRGKIIATVSVTPTTSSVNVGKTIQLAAVALNVYGGAITGNPVTWTSSDTTALTVSSTGLATAVKAGSASVKATIAGISGSATVTLVAVAPSAVTNLAVVSLNDTSATLSFTEVADGAGAAANADVRFMAAPIQWGTATSVTRGTCATPVAGTTVGSTLTCTVLGLTRATAYNFELVSFRGTLNLNAVFGAWSNVAAGTTTSTGTVTAPVVGSVAVTPATATSSVGAKLPLVATVKDKNNNVMTGQVVAWKSSNTAIATIDSTGVTTGMAAGAVTLTATIAGVSGTATVTEAAVAVVVGSVVVTPATATSTVGARLALVATVKDKNNNVMTGQTITWKSSNAAIASVDGAGGTTGMAAGVATITATVGTVSGNAAITEQAVVGNGNPVIGSISRDGGSAAGGAKVTITGSGFGSDAVVKFAGVSSTSVTVVSANSLNVVVPAGAATNPVFPSAVAVSVTSGGVTSTLASAWTYWPAPTTVLGTANFESGINGTGGMAPFTTPIAGSSLTATTEQAHSGSYSLKQVSGSNDDNSTTYGGSWPQSDIVGGKGRWHRWYMFFPAATLASVAHNGQIKLFLSRDATNNFTVVATGPETRDPSQDGANVVGVNNDAGNYHINDASAYLGHYGVEPTITAGVWHEVQVYEYRDPLLGIGYTKAWWDGKKIADSNNINTLFTSYLKGMGDNNPSSSRNAQFGLVYTQNALSYPIVVYIDDVTVANGYIDPQ